MSEMFLLSCECGRTTLVTASESGSTYSCPCGNILDVPQLRDLRKLARAAQSNDARESTWNEQQAIIFLGLLLFVTTAGFAMYKHFSRQPEVDIATVRGDIQKWSAMRCDDEWRKFNLYGISFLTEAEAQREKKDQAAVRWIYFAGVVMLIDLIFILTVFLLGGKNRAKGRWRSASNSQ